MKWTPLSGRIIEFLAYKVTGRGSYSLHRHGDKGWIMWRQGTDWYIYGPYNYRHVKDKYNNL